MRKLSEREILGVLLILTKEEIAMMDKVFPPDSSVPGAFEERRDRLHQAYSWLNERVRVLNDRIS